MNVIPMIAAQYQNYNGHWYRAGEPMEVANEADASDLVALNLASRVKAPMRREMEPATAEGPVIPVTPLPPRTFRAEADEATAEEKAKKKEKKYPNREMRSRQ